MVTSIDAIERRGDSRLVLAACMLLALVFGSIHAFSVFLEPMELRFAAGRSQASLGYSLALLALTVGVLLGHRLFARCSSPHFVLAVCAAAAAGAGLAATAESLWQVWIGYSLVFGGANGLAYAYALQLAAQRSDSRVGVAMGLVTASYALGAALAPAVFEPVLSAGGLPLAMWSLCAALLLAVPAVALPLWRTGVRFRGALPAGDAVPAPRAGANGIPLLWLGYGCGVAAGLMAIGHASGLVDAAGFERSAALLAPAVIALSGIPGSLLGGWLADRWPPRRLMMALPALSLCVLWPMAALPAVGLIIPGLAALGFVYGGLIVVYPAAISQRFGAIEGVRIYGLVFTAWGVAGLGAPWLAGLLYDRSGDYRVALGLAGSLAAVSLLAAWRLSAASAVKRR